MEVIERFSAMSEDSRDFINKELDNFATGSIMGPTQWFLEDNGNDKVLSEMCINILNNEIRSKQYRSWAIFSSGLSGYDRMSIEHTEKKSSDENINNMRDLIREMGYEKKMIIYAEYHTVNIRDPHQIIWKHKTHSAAYAFINDIKFHEAIHIAGKQGAGYMLYCGPEYSDRVVLYYVPANKSMEIYDLLENTAMNDLVLHEARYKITKTHSGRLTGQPFETAGAFERRTGRKVVIDHYLTPAHRISGMGGAYIKKGIDDHINEYILLKDILALEKEDFEKFIEYLRDID